MLQENISEEAIIAYLKANIKNAKKEIEAALKHIQNCAYEMTMQADYEEYELEYEDETGIPASECDTAHFQRWFEDTLLGKELAKIRTLLEELSKEKDLQQRLNSQANAHSAQSPKELIEAIQNYEVLKALHNLAKWANREKVHWQRPFRSM